MNIKHSIGLNLSTDGIPPRLHMVQGDSNTRTIIATLWDGAQSYKIPTGASIMLRFKKPDGTGGLYDTTEGGKSITFFGSTVTVPVATQVLSVAGTVFAELDIYGTGAGKTAEKLSTFLLTIEVAESVYPDAQIISSDYYNVLTGTIATAVTAAQNAAASATAAAASAASAATSVTGAVKYNEDQVLTEDQKEQSRKNIGVTGSTVRVLAAIPSKNILINSDFRPSVRVNQRGQTIYNGAVYGPDCWKGTNDAVRMQLTTLGLYLTGTDATTVPYAQQRIENPDTLRGQTVTFSAINTQGTLFAQTSTLPETLPTSAASYCNEDNVFYLLAINGTLNARLKTSAGGQLHLVAAKLELGDTQTLAHKDADGKWILNDPGDYAKTLWQCQRYLQLYATESFRPSKAADCRPVMRIDPAQTTMTISSTTYYANNAELS